MTKPKYDKSSIKPPPSSKPPPLSLVSPHSGKEANKRPPFFRGLTVLRNATNFREKRDKQNRETSRSL